MIRTLEKLAALDKQLVYLGFEENFSVSNLKVIAEAMPGINLTRQFTKMTFLNHLTLSWMWEHPKLSFIDPLRYGHYVAYTVRVDERQAMDN
jgi:hypothetical protein